MLSSATITSCQLQELCRALPPAKMTKPEFLPERLIQTVPVGTLQSSPQYVVMHTNSNLDIFMASYGIRLYTCFIFRINFVSWNETHPCGRCQICLTFKIPCVTRLRTESPGGTRRYCRPILFHFTSFSHCRVSILP